MFKLLFTFFFIICLFKLSFAYANIESNPQCADLFTTPKTFHQEVRRLIVNESVIHKIDESRMRYYDNSTNTSSVTTYTSALKDVDVLFDRPEVTENEKVALTVGINRILEDLAQISPKYISTRKILEEDIAVMLSQLKYSEIKISEIKEQGNVVTISRDAFSTNSDYISARNKVFAMVDSYSSKNHIPRMVKLMRLEDMLLADVRVQLLRAFEREELAEQIVDALEDSGDNANSQKVGSMLERFFSKSKTEQSRSI